MSKSDAQRRSYLADQMTMGERVEALERQLDKLINEDIQQLSDDAHDSRRRIGKLEKSSNPGMTHFVGDDCAGGHQVTLGRFDSVDFKPSDYVTGEMVDRWRRIEEAARDLLSFDPDERPYGWNMCIDALTEALKP